MARSAFKTIVVAVLLSPVVTVAGLAFLAWVASPSREERLLEERLLSLAKSERPEISLTTELGTADGTVCVTTYEDRMAGMKTHEPWARDAFTSDRSLLAPDDYAIPQISVRTSTGNVRVWEMSRKVPIAGVKYSAWGTTGSELRPACVPLQSAVLRRIGTPAAYVLKPKGAAMGDG